MILTPWTLEVSHGLKQAMAIRDVKWFKTSYGRTFGDSSGTKLTQK